MTLNKILMALAAGVCTLTLGLGEARAQVTNVGKRIPFTEKEYWEDKRFGSDDFWRDYTDWYDRRAEAITYEGANPAQYGVRPYYEAWTGAYPYAEPGDAPVLSPRVRDPYVRMRAGPYPPVRRPVPRTPYTAHQLRLMEENDYLSPDAFEPMDEDVSRWPAAYRDYHDFYTHGGYRRPAYFWPASGLGVTPERYWR